MEKKAQEVLLLCRFGGEAKPCTKDCGFFETCTRNPHKRKKQNNLAEKEGK